MIISPHPQHPPSRPSAHSGGSAFKAKPAVTAHLCSCYFIGSARLPPYHFYWRGLTQILSVFPTQSPRSATAPYLSLLIGCQGFLSVLFVPPEFPLFLKCSRCLVINWGDVWRDDLVVKNACCSCKRIRGCKDWTPRNSCQEIHGLLLDSTGTLHTCGAYKTTRTYTLIHKQKNILKESYIWKQIVI